MAYTYPMMLDVSDRMILIVGGGSVACRKAGGLIEAGAKRIRAVAPRFDPAMPAGVEQVMRPYEPSQLDGAQLVFAATDDADVNAAVVRDARQRGVLVCRADSHDHEPGDFATPAQFRSGGACVTVSASGNPALAVLIRDRLLEQFRPEWGRLAEVMAMLRPAVLKAALSGERRKAILRDLATDEAVSVYAEHGQDGLLRWIEARYPELQAVS